MKKISLLPSYKMTEIVIYRIITRQGEQDERIIEQETGIGD
jgi:hypothetical protein